MRKFIKKITFSLSIFLVLLFSLIVVIEYIINRNSNFKLKTKPKFVVLGHSHPEHALNDTLINSFINLSESGESYYYTFFKAKKIIEQNPTIEVIFIEFTNNQISENMNNWIWSANHMNYRYPRFSSFMNISDKYILARNNAFKFTQSIIYSFKTNLTRILKSDFSYLNDIGGYVNSKENSIKKIIKTDTDRTSIYRSTNISKYNLEYLTKLIKYSKKKGKRIILIRSPQHKKYHGYSNELTYQKTRKEKYSNIEYLDFSNFPLKNSEFRDLEHLNFKGAIRFSTWFNQILEKGLLESSNKQEIISNEIKNQVKKNYSIKK